MQANTIQLLRDPDIEPTSDVIEKALGETNSSYAKFVSKLASHDMDMDWRYYTDVKSWLGKGLFRWTGVRGGQNEITVFWLSIWDGFFKVTIYLPEKAREELLSLPLNSKIKQMIAESPQMGKLKSFPMVIDIYSDDMMEDLFIIADFKKRVK